MLFSDRDEEGADFGAEGGSSKLANLFSDQDIAVESAGNQSLIYVAPRQPKKTDGQLSAQPTLSLLLASAVHAYKFENGKYNNQGKLGAAVLGNHQTRKYTVILYKGKQQQVATATVTPSFMFKVQASNYVNFYDDSRENWSIMFETSQAVADFAKQVALARANSVGSSLDTVIIQDLTVGEGSSLENGDSAEIEYTGWLLTNCSIGQVFDTNSNSDKLLRLKLGTGKVIKGWEEGLLGSKKNSRRFLIIPPKLAYGEDGVANKVPSNATLIFEIYVKKVKLAKDTPRAATPVLSRDSDSGDGKSLSGVKVRSPSIGSEDSIRARGSSISEQLSQSPQSDKAKIISRMAKMGTPTLLMHGHNPPQPSSESETEEEITSRVQPSNFPPVIVGPKPSPKPRSGSTSHSVPPNVPQMIPHHAVTGVPQQQLPTNPPAQQLALYAPQQPFVAPSPFHPYHQAAMPYSLIPQVIPSQAGPPVATSLTDTHMPLLLSETRSQNTEVRLTLSKIADKVDAVLSKLDGVRNQQLSLDQGSMNYMETSTLLSTIQRIVQENSRLKEDIGEKNAKIQALNEKICDLLQRNQKFIEESNNMLEQRSDSLHLTAANSQARLLSLEQDKINLTTELSAAMARMSTMQLEATNAQQRDRELHLNLQTTTYELERAKQLVGTFQDQQKEHEAKAEILQQNLKEVKQQKKELESKVLELEEKIGDLESSKGFLEKNANTRRQQLNEERKRAEKELEETCALHVEQLEALRNKLQKLKASSSNQDKDLEGSIRATLQEHYDKMLEEEATRHEKEIAALRIEKGEAESLHKELSQQMKALTRQYEGKISELQSAVASISSAPGHESDFASELKKAMNYLFRSLQLEFLADESYHGADVLQIVVDTIRTVTLELLQTTQNTHVPRDEPDKVQTMAHTAEEHVTEPEAGTVSDTKAEEELRHRQTSAKSKEVENVNHVESIPQLKNRQPSSSEFDSPTQMTDQHRGCQAEVSDHITGTTIDGSVNADQNSALTVDKDSFSEVSAKPNDLRLESSSHSSASVSSVSWKPQPPPPPLFDDEDDDDDYWLK